MTHKRSFRSICVQEIKENRTTPPHQLPIYATSSFSFDDIDQSIDIFTGKTEGHVYSRYANPTIDSVARKIAALEAYETGKEAYAYLTSSGMSAISSVVISLLQEGDIMLTQGNLYGGTTELFQKVVSSWGIQTIFKDFGDLEAVETTIQEHPKIKMIYLETPANPTLACVDLERITLLARKYKIYTVIDNTFSTPYLQRPFQYDVDVVIHSSTKFLNGHGNSISGVVVSWRPELRKRLWEVIKLVGTNSNAWDAWLLNNGLKTLTIRMDKHCENALALAHFLENHPKVNKVNYIGLKSHAHHDIATKQMKGYGGMLSFEVGGTMAQAKLFINRLTMITMAPTLGDVDSLVLHPASSSHLNVPRDMRILNGISDNLVRLSVGIEDFDDIKNDINQALESI